MRSLSFVFLVWLVAALPVLAADGIREESVHFKPGTSGTTLKGRLHGDQDIDYVLGARAGQRMTVDLNTDNRQNYFNILPPGSDEAIFVGSSAGNHFTGTLPDSGDYRIRVYLMRPAARRGETANYRLGIKIGGGAPAGASAPKADFADGLAGGPDFWQVTGIAANDQLNVRRSPSAKAAIVVGLDTGAVLRNHGCAIHGGQRWCQVSMPDDPGRRGWVAGRYLRESSN
jgi:hypothetical protein